MRSAGADVAGEHLAHLDGGRAGDDDGIAGREGPELVFVVGFDDAETPRAGAVEHGAEHHHLTGLDQWLPVGGVAAHDLPLLVGHVEGERGAGRHEPEHERAQVCCSCCSCMAVRMAWKMRAASSTRWSRARNKTRAPAKIGGEQTRKAMRRSPVACEIPKTSRGAMPPNTIDAKLKNPKPAPRRLAGTASVSPARRAGIAMLVTKTPANSRGKATPNGTHRYEKKNRALPASRQ